MPVLYRWSREYSATRNELCTTYVGSGAIPRSAPSRESHTLSATREPSYTRNTELLPEGLGPSVLIFHVSANPKDRKAMYSFFHRSSLKLETSYGLSYTKLDPWAKNGPTDKYDLVKLDKKKKKSGLWIRVAIGYDDTLEHIVEGLKPLLGSLWQ